MARSRKTPLPPAVLGGKPWWQALALTEKRTAKICAYNADVALSQDPDFAGAIKFDAFRGQTMVCAPLPWDPNALVPRPWTSSDDYETTIWLQDNDVMVPLRMV